MRALVLASTVVIVSCSPALAQKPQCAVGFNGPIAMANYPGTIVAVDEENGAYQVKQQDGRTSWHPSEWLARSCVGAEPRPQTEAYFVGRWSTFVPPYPRYEVISSKRYLVVGTGAAGFPIEIKGDGTYSWVTNNNPVQTLTGRWRVLEPNEYKYGTKPKNAPVLLLMKAYSDADWYVSRKGVSLEGVQQIHIEQMKMGLTQSGTRIR